MSAPAPNRSAILDAPAAKLDCNMIFELRRLHREVGIPDVIADWDAEDRRLRDEDRAAEGKPPVRGGRPAALDLADVLLVGHALLISGHDALLTSIAAAFRERLRPPSRRLLGLPAHEPMSNCDRYSQVHSRMQHLENLVSPNLGIAGRRRYPAEYRAILESLDREGKDRRLARGIMLANLLIETSLRLLPPDLFEKWDGSVCIDATPVPVHGRRGNPAGFGAGRGDGSKLLSAEPDAGWYVRDGDHGEAGAKSLRDAVFAYEAHLAVMTQPTGADGRTPRDFPYLAAALSLDAPGKRTAENAATLLRSVADRGHPRGDLVTDRLYLPMSKPDKFQRIVHAFGYRPVFDYPVRNLGLQASIDGFKLVDGNLYSPSLPPHLYDVTKRHAAGQITDEELEAAIAERAPYLAQLKQSIDEHGRFRVGCPAAGKAPTVFCSRNQEHSDAPRREGRKSLPLVMPRPDQTGPSCRQQSVTMNLATNDQLARLYQPLQYRSLEWSRRYKGPRSIVESYNAHAKDPQYGRLAESGLRRVRGYGKQLIVIALMVSAANINRIRSFLANRRDDGETAAPTPTGPARRKPRLDATLADHAQPNAPPGWLPGHAKPAAA
ncbi:hypothetical protein USB125703_01685 [Pseudoclavibacter triregionum]|nr:hypothetical protein USB125703_01685 [Pseudoclavibacter triregionum]